VPAKASLYLFVVMRRVLIPAVSALVGIAVIALLAFGLTQQGTSRSFDEDIALGHPPLAPVASLPRLQGSGTSSVAAYRGRIVVLNFWASWCEPCQQEAPMLERAQHQLVAHGGTVLGVTYDDTSDDSLSFVRQYGLTYPMLRDVTGSYAHRFGTDQLPESFVIDRAGRIVAISRGEVTATWLTSAIARASSAA